MTKWSIVFAITLVMNYSLKSSFYEEINTRLEDKSTSKERKNILKMVLTAVEYLSSSKIYIYLIH